MNYWSVNRLRRTVLGRGMAGAVMVARSHVNLISLIPTVR